MSEEGLAEVGTPCEGAGPPGTCVRCPCIVATGAEGRSRKHEEVSEGQMVEPPKEHGDQRRGSGGGRLRGRGRPAPLPRGPGLRKSTPHASRGVSWPEVIARPRGTTSLQSMPRGQRHLHPVA